MRDCWGFFCRHTADYRKSPEDRNPRLIPQRLARNIGDDNPFAVIYRLASEVGLARKSLTEDSILHHLRRNRDPMAG